MLILYNIAAVLTDGDLSLGSCGPVINNPGVVTGVYYLVKDNHILQLLIDLQNLWMIGLDQLVY